MAERWHGPAVKHRLRDYCLYGMSKLPVRQQGGDHKRVLIIRPDHVGDVLLTTPAIQLLKRRQPEIEIHVLCGAASAEVLSNYSEIDLVLTLPFPGFERGAGAKTNPYLLALRSARMLRRIGYGSAVIMRPDHWWGAYLAFLAGIRERIGYDIANVKPFLSSAVEHSTSACGVAEYTLGRALDGRSCARRYSTRFSGWGGRSRISSKEILRIGAFIGNGRFCVFIPVRAQAARFGQRRNGLRWRMRLPVVMTRRWFSRARRVKRR